LTVWNPRSKKTHSRPVARHAPEPDRMSMGPDQASADYRQLSEKALSPAAIPPLVAPADLPPMIGPPGSQRKTTLRWSPLSCVPRKGIRSNREFIRAQERYQV